MIVARRDCHTININNSFFKKSSQNMLGDNYSDYEEQKKWNKRTRIKYNF